MCYKYLVVSSSMPATSIGRFVVRQLGRKAEEARRPRCFQIVERRVNIACLIRWLCTCLGDSVHAWTFLLPRRERVNSRSQFAVCEQLPRNRRPRIFITLTLEACWQLRLARCRLARFRREAAAACWHLPCVWNLVPHDWVVSFSRIQRISRQPLGSELIPFAYDTKPKT